MEGQDLLNLVKGKAFNAELRAVLAKEGYRRLGNQWVSKQTAAKYELLFTEDGDTKIVSGVDLIDGSHRMHIVDSTATSIEEEPAVSGTVHHKTVSAIMRQLDISYRYFELMDQWNYEMDQQTPLGQQLATLVKQPQIIWENFVFLPDPLASGEYLFGAIREGLTAQLHAWLIMPDGRSIVPTDGTPDGAFESLVCGQEFHAWEFENFDTPAAAGQYAIKMLNNSATTYAQAIHRLLGKESGNITRNDFFRDHSGVMCRVEVVRDEFGLHVSEVPCLPTVADCIDSLLAPYIKQRAYRNV